MRISFAFRFTIIRLISLLLCASLLVTSCGNESIANRIQIMVTVGFDREQNSYKGSVLYPDYIQRKGSLAVFKGVGKEPRLIMDQFERKSSRMVKYNKINTFVFSHAMANEHMKTVIDTIVSDPSLSSKVLLAVSTCSAEKIVNSLDRKELENLPYYIVEQNVRIGALPPSNLHLFLHDLFSEGKDPSMPSIALDEQREIKIDGYALFKKDRLKLILDLNETTLFHLLQGDSTKGELPFIYEGEEYVLSMFQSHARQTIDHLKTPAVRYDVSLNGRIINYQGNNIAKDPAQARTLTQAIEVQVKNQAIKLLQKLQFNQLDSLGIGERFRSEDRNWKAAAFYKDIYPNLKFDVYVNVNLKNSGSGE